LKFVGFAFNKTPPTTTTIMSTRQSLPNENSTENTNLESVNQQMANTQLLTPEEKAARELATKRLQRKETKT